MSSKVRNVLLIQFAETVTNQAVSFEVCRLLKLINCALSVVIVLFWFHEKCTTMIFKYILQIGLLIVATFAQVQHKAVLENDAYEQTLSNELRNPFYRAARVRSALKQSSWLGPGEELVIEHQAEKIPRSEIYSVLSHAGLIPRSRHQFRN